MQKQKIALFIEDEEHRNRLSLHLLKQEKDRFELHLFTDDKLLVADEKLYDAILYAGGVSKANEIAKERKEPVFYLYDEEDGELLIDSAQNHIILLDKYQNVNRILDEMRKKLGDEYVDVEKGCTGKERMQAIGVYGLAENEYQLPFLVTLASVLGEEKRVLILDLQENSGFSHLQTEPLDGGLEEVLAMAESGKMSKARLLSCIGHLNQADYIAPAENSECLCEANAALYLKMLQMIAKELDYSVVLLNFGSRFKGFFELIGQCKQVYLITKKGGLCQWREYEFTEEAKKKGFEDLMEQMVKVEIPSMSVSISCERLVEQWKWNEFGDMIRRMLLAPASKRRE